MQVKNLPPLEVGQAYTAQDFQRFEYYGAALTGQSAILRLHLANGTTIDIPTTDEELRRLMFVLCDVLPAAAIGLFRKRGWV